MARIFPFRAIRYNTNDVAIADVVTQPYDKITPAMQQGYYARSAYNLVRVILGLPELFDAPGENDVYTRAARDFAEWRAQGILYKENEPCVFAYQQRFVVPGTGEMQIRRGMIALGALEEYAQGTVFRHEQTLAQPKTDRGNLLEATRTHFGPVFMLYSDPGLTVERTLFGAGFRADVEFTDEFGVEHSLARVSEPNTINILAGAMADKKLIIADGHHRYETAVAYAQEHAPAKLPHLERNLSNSLPAPAYPEAATLMAFVNMDSDGLVILPTHRVVHGLAGFDAAGFLERVETFFSIADLGGLDAESLMLRLAEVNATAFVAVTEGGRYLLTSRSELVASALDGMSERQKRLDVVVLHGVVLKGLLGIDDAAIVAQTHVRYMREAQEAIAQVMNGSAQVAFLMNACLLDQMREIAFAGEVMPQKSTDFYPKILSGLAMYGLD